MYFEERKMVNRPKGLVTAYENTGYWVTHEAKIISKTTGEEVVRKAYPVGATVMVQGGYEGEVVNAYSNILVVRLKPNQDIKERELVTLSTEGLEIVTPLNKNGLLYANSNTKVGGGLH